MLSSIYSESWARSMSIAAKVLIQTICASNLIHQKNDKLHAEGGRRSMSKACVAQFPVSLLDKIISL